MKSDYVSVKELKLGDVIFDESYQDLFKVISKSESIITLRSLSKKEEFEYEAKPNEIFDLYKGKLSELVRAKNLKKSDYIYLRTNCATGGSNVVIKDIRNSGKVILRVLSKKKVPEYTVILDPNSIIQRHSKEVPLSGEAERTEFFHQLPVMVKDNGRYRKLLFELDVPYEKLSSTPDFKVGDRVRIIDTFYPKLYPDIIGKTGTIYKIEKNTFGVFIFCIDLDTPTTFYKNEIGIEVDTYGTGYEFTLQHIKEEYMKLSQHVVEAALEQKQEEHDDYIQEGLNELLLDLQINNRSKQPWEVSIADSGLTHQAPIAKFAAEHKFKIGDKVKVVKVHDVTYYPDIIGKTGVIKKTLIFLGKLSYEVEFDTPYTIVGSGWKPKLKDIFYTMLEENLVLDEYMKLASEEFKVGDKVKIIKAINIYLTGLVGEIIGFKDDLLEVKFSGRPGFELFSTSMVRKQNDKEFQIGDKVEVIGAPNSYKDLLNREGTVVGYKEDFNIKYRIHFDTPFKMKGSDGITVIEKNTAYLSKYDLRLIEQYMKLASEPKFRLNQEVESLPREYFYNVRGKIISIFNPNSRNKEYQYKIELITPLIMKADQNSPVFEDDIKNGRILYIDGIKYVLVDPPGAKLTYSEGMLESTEYMKLSNHKFKVGDKVTILSTLRDDIYPDMAGKIGTIFEVRNRVVPWYYIKTDTPYALVAGGKTTYHDIFITFREETLKLVKEYMKLSSKDLKVGDKVKVLNSLNKDFIGKTGVISYINADYLYRVVFEDNRYSYIAKSDLELLEEYMKVSEKSISGFEKVSQEVDLKYEYMKQAQTGFNPGWGKPYQPPTTVTPSFDPNWRYTPPNVPTAIQQSILNRDTLKFTYTNVYNNQTNERWVKPMRTFVAGTGNFILLTWDLKRDYWRCFIIPRIQNMQFGEKFIVDKNKLKDQLLLNHLRNNIRKQELAYG